LWIPTLITNVLSGCKPCVHRLPLNVFFRERPRGALVGARVGGDFEDVVAVFVPAAFFPARQALSLDGVALAQTPQRRGGFGARQRTRALERRRGRRG
jgi:hypothetical protein